MKKLIAFLLVLFSAAAVFGAADVVSFGKPVFDVKAPAGGYSAAERAAIINGRIAALSASGFHEVTVKKNSPGSYSIFADDKIMFDVNDSDAAAEKTDIKSLAAHRAQQLADCLKSAPMTAADSYITLDNIKALADTNADIVKKPVKGIRLFFHGLGGMAGINSPGNAALAEKGIVDIAPSYGPWGWMNRAGVAVTDACVEAVIRELGLRNDIPIVSVGSSMGGLAALVYACYARYPVAAVACDSPVCDAVYHFGERPELPMTFAAALADYPCSMDEALKSISPVHLVNRLPKVPYFIVHGTADKAVSKEHHSDRLVTLLKARGYDVTYVECEGMEHCAIPEEAAIKFHSFIENAILK